MNWSVDTIIKAPLWAFFAAFIFSTVPLLDIDFINEAGAAKEILGVPLVNISIGSFSLFLSSATARSYKSIVEKLGALKYTMHWRWTLSRLPHDAKVLLGTLEELSKDWFYYNPRSPEIAALRDLDLIQAELIREDGEGWGKYELTYVYRTACAKRRALFRSKLKYSHDRSAAVRTKMQKALEMAYRTG
ncbi:MAG: hypothetical protein AB7U61_00915 [Methylocystis sp.]